MAEMSIGIFRFFVLFAYLSGEIDDLSEFRSNSAFDDPATPVVQWAQSRQVCQARLWRTAFKRKEE
jgi:hypothetical protein